MSITSFGLETRDGAKQEMREGKTMLRFHIRISELLKSFAVDAQGATAIEYGLIAAGIAVAIITVVGLLGDELAAMFGQVQTEIANR
jgi:pilus assembly protein Flp/PilA